MMESTPATNQEWTMEIFHNVTLVTKEKITVLNDKSFRRRTAANMDELPDGRIYGKFVALDYAVTVGVGRRYLIAVTKKAVGLQMGPSNSVGQVRDATSGH